jgi:hypothetical protein
VKIADKLLSMDVSMKSRVCRLQMAYISFRKYSDMRQIAVESQKSVAPLVVYVSAVVVSVRVAKLFHSGKWIHMHKQSTLVFG